MPDEEQALNDKAESQITMPDARAIDPPTVWLSKRHTITEHFGKAKEPGIPIGDAWAIGGRGVAPQPA